MSRPPYPGDPPVPGGKGPPKGGLSPEDEELIESIAGRVVAMGMSVPAILFVESSKPLSFVGSQFLYFFEPIVRAFIRGDQYNRFARLLEERENVELLLSAIERKEAESQVRRKAERAADKAQKAEEKARRRKLREERKP